MLFKMRLCVKMYMYLWRKFEDDLDLKGARNEGFVGLS